MADDNQTASLENQFTDDELKSMGSLYAKLVNDQKTREFTLRATKHVAPQTPIPEIDVLDRVGAAVKPHIEKIDKLEKEMLKKSVEEKIEKKRADLRGQGYTQQEIEAVEKLMVEKQIPDHMTAAEFYRLQSKSVEPTPSHYVSPTKLPYDKEKGKAAGGWRKFYTQDAHQAIDDIRAGRIKLN